ncbi:MAG TPA: CHAD domain-containing protein [Acidobacteriaceae bacterium]
MATLANTFEQLHRDLAAAVVACRADPSSHAVHSLRSSTRRVEALSRKVLEEHPRALRLRGKLENALDELRKVRTAAGRVRDLDVQSLLIVEIAADVRAVGSIRQRKELREDCAELDAVLRRRRKRVAERFLGMLEDEEPRLERALDRIPKAMEGLHGTSTLKTAMSWVQRNSLELNDTSSESLHCYRKRIKAARYLAEMQGSSPVATRLANQLKKVLDAIGRWHDLKLLAQAAKALLGKQAMLAGFIREERDRALQRAIHAAGSMRPRKSSLAPG